MRYALKNIYLGWHAFWIRTNEVMWSIYGWLTSLSRRWKLAVGGAVLALFLGLFWLDPAAALLDSFMNIGGSIGSMVMLVVSTIALAVLSFFMLIALLLTKLLIAVSLYNDFVNATAVNTGWPLIRDVVNMFFIVVLLIIAFSTIIGYKEFDYKKHVPRLLLMAVLINFSKTLVGLLIDFSQVVMLTFVNGFKEAAFGNFIKAFGLDKITTIAKKGLGGNGFEAMADSTSLLISILFGILMLIVISTLILIMLIYLVARVIAIWILLIFSPLAFFVWALPPKLAKALSKFSNLWWEQLSSWLTGGPIMAFFLWLTMAIVASSSNPFGNVMPKDDESSYVMKFLNEAADFGNLANFVVATVLLFYGLKTAVEQSKSASASLGKLAEGIKSSGGPIGGTIKLAGRAAGAAVKTGGKVAGKGLAFGAKSLDTKYGYSKKLGTSMSGLGVQLGKWGEGKGGLIGALATGGAKAIQTKAAGFTTMGAERYKTAKEAFAKRHTGQPLKQQIEAENVMLGSADKNDRKVGAAARMTRFLDPRNRKAETSGRIKELKAHYASAEGGGKSAEEAERLAIAQANAEYDQKLIAEMAKIEKDDDLNSDAELMEKIKTVRKDNLGLYDSLDKIKASVKSRTLDQTPAAAYRNLDVGLAALESAELMSGGVMVAGWEDKVRAIEGLNSSQRDALLAMGAVMQTDVGKEAYQAYASGKASGMSLSVGANGAYTLLGANGAIVAEQASNKQRIQQQIQQASGNRLTGQALEQFASGFSQPPTQTQLQAIGAAFNAGAYEPGATSYSRAAAQAMGAVQAQGVPTSIAFGVQRDGSYQSSAYQAAHADVMSTAAKNLSSADGNMARGAVNVFISTSPETITGRGQAAETVLKAIEGKLDELVIAAEQHVPGSEPKVEVFVRAVAEAGRAAQNKAQIPGAVLSQAEAKAKEILEKEIMKDGTLRKMAHV